VTIVGVLRAVVYCNAVGTVRPLVACVARARAGIGTLVLAISVVQVAAAVVRCIIHANVDWRACHAISAEVLGASTLPFSRLSGRTDSTSRMTVVQTVCAGIDRRARCSIARVARFALAGICSGPSLGALGITVATAETGTGAVVDFEACQSRAFPAVLALARLGIREGGRFCTICMHSAATVDPQWRFCLVVSARKDPFTSVAVTKVASLASTVVRVGSGESAGGVRCAATVMFWHGATIDRLAQTVDLGVTFVTRARVHPSAFVLACRVHFTGSSAISALVDYRARRSVSPRVTNVATAGVFTWATPDASGLGVATVGVSTLLAVVDGCTGAHIACWARLATVANFALTSVPAGTGMYTL
jgi:hypothetical protein